MAKPRQWGKLAPGTKKRYLAAGAKQGKSASAVRSYYNRGGNMSAYRGHANPLGVSERQWTVLRGEYTDGGDLDWDGTLRDAVLRALAHGLTPPEIARLISNRRKATEEFRRNGNRAPGRAEYGKRPKWATIDEPARAFYWYH